jgi:hypothetical protein
MLLPTFSESFTVPSRTDGSSKKHKAANPLTNPKVKVLILIRDIVLR